MDEVEKIFMTMAVNNAEFCRTRLDLVDNLLGKDYFQTLKKICSYCSKERGLIFYTPRSDTDDKLSKCCVLCSETCKKCNIQIPLDFFYVKFNSEVRKLRWCYQCCKEKKESEVLFEKHTSLC